ncbi:MAG: prepilin-type N-terminal cleavage/methylation domain-containing protein [Geminicoccaceae bacterium]
MAGFTLLETLVALAILGVIMTTVYAVIGSGLRMAHRDEDRLLLGLVAQNLLARSRLDLNPKDGPMTGDIDGGLRWRIEAEPYPVPKDLLPEAPPEQASSLAKSPGTESETSTSMERGDSTSMGQTGARASNSTGGPSSDLRTSEGEQQQTREQLRLRQIRVLVEKGDQSFSLSTLELEPPRVRSALP